ncbi:probable prolyl 4-hydroxylase 9 [Phragmites australis]|uniref:probable prolyl 4-hydroxylase 9 n=1 Tax=Phragmites australis TaxID=29695 RepID=UPI002D791937|nr:probable prolyl 4-hydroxylase 9 [Phragmites australis]
MKGGGVVRGVGLGGGAGLMRTRLRLPVVLLSCSLFFLAGFFGSILFTQDPEETDLPAPRERLLEAAWPEMPFGESGEPAPSLIPFQILSWQPRAFYFPQFATSDQCENIVRTAKERLAPSTLALRKGETAESTKGIRTSSGTFLSANEDPSGTLAEVEKKIARATMIPRNHGELFNVLRYEIGQRYASHYDAFDPAQYGPQKSQRVASFLLYLTDVEVGGETMFPYENGENMDIGYDYEKCIGLKVKPRKGDGLLFYSLMVNGTIDPTSLHGSCPVMKGEKWVATKWIRDNTV